MATTAAILENELKALSNSIGMNAEKFNQQALLDSQNIITRQINDKKVSFVFDKSLLLKVILETDQKQIKIPKEDLYGIPKECLKDPVSLIAFLDNSYLRLTEFLDNKGYKLTATLKLKGGGNIGVGINTWPVIREDGEFKFVIPYEIHASTEAVILHNKPDSNSEEKLKRKLMNDINKGKRPDLSREMNVVHATLDAISKWQETGLVKLVPINEMKKLYPTISRERWIKFITKNDEGVCQAPCIGMCPDIGEHVVTCDIEGIFDSNPVQSIMHEIGHILGLRHEFSRSDRDCYIKTTFAPEEQTSKPVGKYDHDSIMQYEYGEYDIDSKHKHEHYPIKDLNPLIPKPTRTIDFSKVGRRPVISTGDKEAVKELISIAVERESELREKSKMEAEKEARQIRQFLSYNSSRSVYSKSSYHYQSESEDSSSEDMNDLVENRSSISESHIQKHVRKANYR